MRGVEFSELRAFAAIAEHGSFAKAASQLGLSRSMLSQSLRALEERLKIRLINRTTRSVSLTDAGNRLLARVRPALGELTSAVEEARSLQSYPAGLLRLVRSAAGRKFSHRADPCKLPGGVSRDSTRREGCKNAGGYRP